MDKINLSSDAYKNLQLQAHAEFNFAKRGQLNIKGKGHMQVRVLPYSAPPVPMTLLW